MTNVEIHETVELTELGWQTIETLMDRAESIECPTCSAVPLAFCDQRKATTELLGAPPGIHRARLRASRPKQP